MEDKPNIPGRRPSSPQSSVSQTAQEYISSQLQLEADAREALPYQFDACTKSLGPLRQSIFACLTCTPPPASKHQQFQPAGICYSCSISCHGEHNLVELFTMRNFVCDCGTSRFTNGAPCELRPNPQTGTKGGVSGEEPRDGNKYNQNYQGNFCGCGEEYDPEREKGTMFQCLGLGTVEDGGCGEDWWHPECLMGLPRHTADHVKKIESNGALERVREEDTEGDHAQSNGHTLPKNSIDEEPPLPDGFPAEDDFDHLICYKCADSFPWIKDYAGSIGFLPGLPLRVNPTDALQALSGENSAAEPNAEETGSRKRKAADDESDVNPEQNSKKTKQYQRCDATSDSGKPSGMDAVSSATNGDRSLPKHATLNQSSYERISLFLKHDFRDYLCRCPECFSRLKAHPQLLEEEESYEPPLSESDNDENASAAGRSVNSGSLLERGEAALNGVDRVRAIEGVMAYNHMKDKVKEFLKPYAESGQAVGAEDIKAYFAKLRGDEAATKTTPGDGGEDGVQRDGRREQDGY